MRLLFYFVFIDLDLFLGYVRHEDRDHTKVVPGAVTFQTNDDMLRVSSSRF